MSWSFHTLEISLSNSVRSHIKIITNTSSCYGMTVPFNHICIIFGTSTLCKVNHRPWQGKLWVWCGWPVAGSCWFCPFYPLPAVLTELGLAAGTGSPAWCRQFSSKCQELAKAWRWGWGGERFVTHSSSQPCVCMEMVPEGAPVLLQNWILLSCEQRQKNLLSLII